MSSYDAWLTREDIPQCPECSANLHYTDDRGYWCGRCGWREHEVEECPECGAEVIAADDGTWECPECGAGSEDNPQ